MRGVGSTQRGVMASDVVVKLFMYNSDHRKVVYWTVPGAAGMHLRKQHFWKKHSFSFLCRRTRFRKLSQSTLDIRRFPTKTWMFWPVALLFIGMKNGIYRSLMTVFFYLSNSVKLIATSYFHILKPPATLPNKRNQLNPAAILNARKI